MSIECYAEKCRGWTTEELRKKQRGLEQTLNALVCQGRDFKVRKMDKEYDLNLTAKGVVCAKLSEIEKELNARVPKNSWVPKLDDDE